MAGVLEKRSFGWYGSLRSTATYFDCNLILVYGLTRLNRSELKLAIKERGHF